MKETVKIIAPEICLLPDGPAHHAGVVVAGGSICATGSKSSGRNIPERPSSIGNANA